MVNAPCAAAYKRQSQARPKPRGAHGPIADPERPPWNAHQLGGSAEPPNSPTPVKWIGQALLTPPASHLSRPVRIRPVASWSRIWSRVLSRPRRASTAPHLRVARKRSLHDGRRSDVRDQFSLLCTSGSRLAGNRSMRRARIVGSIRPDSSMAAANAKSFSRYATSLDTTQSCGSRNAARARPVDWFDQGTTRPRQPSGSTAVRTLTPCAYTPFISWNGESSPIAPSTAGCEPAVHDSPAHPDSISPAAATGGGLAGLPMVPTPAPHEGCQDP